jgi:hypothetical protein
MLGFLDFTNFRGPEIFLFESIKPLFAFKFFKIVLARESCSLTDDFFDEILTDRGP